MDEGAERLIWGRSLDSEGDPEVTYIFTETSHGFAVFDAVGHDGSNWVKADASSGGQDGIGIVTEVPSANTFRIAVYGIHTILSHGATDGWNYLSTTAGAVSTSFPTSINDTIQPMLFVIDDNVFEMQIGKGIK